MRITKGKTYRIKASSRFFDTLLLSKSSPKVLITHHDTELYKNGWYYETNCAPCLAFALRMDRMRYPDGFVQEGVWVGTIQDFRVLVHEDELEEV